MADDVDSTGVPAAGEDDQPALADVYDEGLVVDHQGIVLPGLAGPRLMRGRHAVFEVGHAVDLAGDQDAPVDEQRGLLPLDESETFGGQRARIEGRHLRGLGTRWDQPAAGP